MGELWNVGWSDRGRRIKLGREKYPGKLFIHGGRIVLRGDNNPFRSVIEERKGTRIIHDYDPGRRLLEYELVSL
jgi:hypothetical protein